MRSFQRRLTVPLTLGLTGIFFVGGLVLDHFVQAAVWGALDASLAGEARRLSEALHVGVEPAGQTEFNRLGADVLREINLADSAAERRRAHFRELAVGRLAADLSKVRWGPAAGGSATPHHFEVRDRAGVLLARSRSLDGRELAPAGRLPPTGPTTLPDGSRGRAVTLRLTDVPFDSPAWQRSWSELRQRLKLPPVSATVVVATNAEEQHALLASLRTALLVSGVLLVLGAAGLAVCTTRRALAPLRDLRNEVSRLDAATLDRAVRLSKPPADLVPIVDALNAALNKLDDAFTRERRMTADLAHELRTPVAELKSITDVARQWPDDAALQARCATQCHAVADRMTRLVSALSRLARIRTGQSWAAAEVIDLRQHMLDSWRLLRTRASAREQRFDLAQGPAAHVRSDPDIVESVLSNLIQNAIEHAPPGSLIEARIGTEPGGAALSLSNPAGALTAREAANATRAFWRGDGARTGVQHAGLGLSIVADIARVADLEFHVTVEDGVFRATVVFGQPAGQTSIT